MRFNRVFQRLEIIKRSRFNKIIHNCINTLKPFIQTRASANFVIFREILRNGYQEYPKNIPEVYRFQYFDRGRCSTRIRLLSLYILYR